MNSNDVYKLIINTKDLPNTIRLNVLYDDGENVTYQLHMYYIEVKLQLLILIKHYQF